MERAGGRNALDAFLEDRVTAGKPLNLEGFTVIGIGKSSHLKLPGYEVKRPAFEKHIDVVDGRMVEAPTGQAAHNPDSASRQ